MAAQASNRTIRSLRVERAKYLKSARINPSCRTSFVELARSVNRDLVRALRAER